MTEPVPSPGSAPVDPELEALPPPRRPWRRATMVTLVATAVSSLGLAWALREPVRFAIRRGPPEELGELSTLRLRADLANTWAHVAGPLGNLAAEYRRPLDPDTYRLVASLQAPNVWIELRIPASVESERYVPPNSFVGRLVPIDRVGPQRGMLTDAITTAFGRPPEAGAWVLLDGEAPSTSRWAVAFVALLFGFFTFSVWGLVRLLQPTRDGDARL